VITSETPYKLAEIIADTWPQLYRKPKMVYNRQEYEQQNEGTDQKKGVNQEDR